MSNIRYYCFYIILTIPTTVNFFRDQSVITFSMNLFKIQNMLLFLKILCKMYTEQHERVRVSTSVVKPATRVGPELYSVQSEGLKTKISI